MTEIRDALTIVRSGDGIDTGRDPGAVARLGEALAERLRSEAPEAPEAVVCWEGDDESVLAHAVAVALGVPVLRATEDMGILIVSGPRSPGLRVALVATRWDARNPAGSLLGLVRNESLRPVALASVVSSAVEAADGVPVMALDGE